ncbi:MAG TPA: hypothetical protein VGS58_12265 [Candidatus Sulfopaludibacter sp.]|nr:hypothetical protein [Candidatus Sulfopaludibacter sp.]
MTAWVGLRRPLLVALVLGCAVSLMTSGRLTLRLAGPAAVYWSFVPLCEIASLAVVAGRRGTPFARTIDRYFEGHAAWLLWATAFVAVWAFVPAPAVYGWRWRTLWWYGSAAAVFAWSAYVDFGFFRRVLGRSAGRAARDLAIQRALSWAAGLAIFVAPAGWQELASWLGL